MPYPQRLRNLLGRVRRRMTSRGPVRGDSVADYWTRHNVTGHHRFASAAESLAFFHWRNSQYPNYIALMPVAGFDGRAVLDFGCGPGHDLVGFSTYSECKTLVGVDVSPTSIAEARSRLRLHGSDAEMIEILPGRPLPFPDAAFDHIHTSGVLHHVEDPVSTLKELRRVLKPAGTLHAMVYNRDSIWTHLKVAYLRTIVEGLYGDLSLAERFARSTDGEDCPISRCYQPAEFMAVARTAGFDGRFAGAAVSLIELSLLPRRFEAMMDPRLPAESREFLESLTFDQQMIPHRNGQVAGIDGVYHLRVS